VGMAGSADRPEGVLSTVGCRQLPATSPREGSRGTRQAEVLLLGPAEIAPPGGIGGRGHRRHRLSTRAGVALQRPQAGVAALGPQ
jgi:hypothetical protein